MERFARGERLLSVRGKLGLVTGLAAFLSAPIALKTRSDLIPLQRETIEHLDEGRWWGVFDDAALFGAGG